MKFKVNPDDGFIKDYKTIQVGDYINNDEIVKIINHDKYDVIILKEERGYFVFIVESSLILCSEAFFDSIEEAMSSYM